MERKKTSDFSPEVLKIFDGYVHGRISRRQFLDDAGKYAVGGFTAAAMLESLRPNYAWAQQVAQDDNRIKTEYVTYPSPQGTGTMKGYLAKPANATGKLPGVVVIHENRGLNPYIEDVARRLAVDGFLAFAPDGTVVGSCRSESGAWTGEAEDLVDEPGIAPEHRALKLQRPMVLTALRWLREQGRRPVRLESWGDTPETVALYQEIGFKLVEHALSLAISLK